MAPRDRKNDDQERSAARRGEGYSRETIDAQLRRSREVVEKLRKTLREDA